MTKLLIALLLSVLCGGSFAAIYEDQVGLFDWHQKYVGNVVEAIADVSTKQLVTITEGLALATIHQNGTLGWRKVFSPKEKPISLTVNDNAVVVGTSNNEIRVYDIANGDLIWAESVSTISDETIMAAKVTKGTGNDFVVVVLSTTNVYVYDLITGTLLFQTSLPDGQTGEELSLGDASYITCGSRAGVKVLTIDFDNKKVIDVADIDINGPERIYSIIKDIIVYKCNQNEICTYNLSTKNKSEYREKFGNALSINYIGSDNYVGFEAENSYVVAFLDSKNELKSSVVHEKKGVLFGYESAAFDTFFISWDMDVSASCVRNSLVNGQISKTKSIIVDLPAETANHLDFSKAFGYTHGENFNVFAVTQDHAILHFDQDNYLATREEALASIVTSEYVDLPGNQKQIQLLIDEFRVTDDESLVGRLADRLYTQAVQIKNFFFDTYQEVVKLTGGQPKSPQGRRNRAHALFNEDKLTADVFNMRKMLVVLSSNGKAFGLLSSTGELVWTAALNSRHLSFSPSSKFSLYAIRISAHFPHPPVVVAIGTDENGNGAICEIDPLNGKLSVSTLDSAIQNVLMLKDFDAQFIHPLMILDANKKVHVYPNNESAMAMAEKAASQTYMFTVDKANGICQGYRFINAGKEIKSKESWRLSFDNEKIVNAVTNPPYDIVKVQFKVVDHNKNVLYKYLNPNLLSVATFSKDLNNLNIYLIDSVVGRIIHRVTHENVGSDRPVTMVHAENSVYYHYWSVKDMKYVVVVLDLFEDGRIDDRKPFSSHVGATPLVVRQAYFFSSGVTAASLTQTQQAITMKQLLFGLENGALYAVDKKLVDARRVASDSKTAIPGVPAYTPVLLIDPKSVINYNKTVANIKGITTSATHLESHGLVFVHGLDLFSSRVTPSSTFDMLSEEFNKPFLLLTVFGILAGVLITKHYLNKKNLFRQWK